MEKFVYYQIEGFLPSSFISHELGNVVKFADRKKAIDTLGNVLNKWKNDECFTSNGELVHENIYDDKLLGGYRHQFVFKQKRTGMFYELSFKVVKHQIVYIK